MEGILSLKYLDVLCQAFANDDNGECQSQEYFGPESDIAFSIFPKISSPKDGLVFASGSLYAQSTFPLFLAAIIDVYYVQSLKHDYSQ